MAQDNENFRERVTNAVLHAVTEAGRAHPGAKDIHLDMNVALDGMCRAMAIWASTAAQMIGDPEKGAQALGEMEEQLSSQLRYLAEKVRNGSMSIEGREKPTLRLVD